MRDDIKTNLIAQHKLLEAIGHDLTTLECSHNDADIEELRRRSERLRGILDERGLISEANAIPSITQDVGMTERADVPLKNYDDITRDNLRLLTHNAGFLDNRGLLDREFDSLFSPEDLDRISRELSSPIAREKWDRWDFVAVLSAGITGIVADFFTDGIDACLKDWLGHIHIKSPQVPIDYQGPSFAGPFHRGLSSGHDILRVFSAIWQIKNGTFSGLKQTPNGFEWVTKTQNQFGVPYDTQGGLEAFLIWVKHELSDFITPNSLPFPGMSFLTQMRDHDVRKFAIQLYQHGYNLRYILAQALAPALVELVVRGYIMGREYKEIGEIRFPSAKRLKATEMLLASHAMVMAVNVGKVAIKCHAEGPLALRNLNVPSIIMTVRYLVPFVVKTMKRYDSVEILKRNAQIINEGYDGLLVTLRERLEKDQEFNEFLHDGNVIVV